MPSHESFLLVLSNVIAFILLFVILRPSLKKPLGKTKILFSWIIVLMFCIFSFWGPDWFHSLESWTFYHSVDAPSHLEDIYLYLIKDVSNTYLEYRLIVWGCTLILIYMTSRRLKLRNDVTLLCFVIASLIWISYARASWAMALMFFGASLLASKDTKIDLKTAPLGLLCIFLSLYLHKSAFFGIAVIAAGFISTFTSKKIFRLLIVLFPIFVLLMSNYLMDYMSFQAEDELMQNALSSSQGYLSNDISGALNLSSGWGTVLSKLLEWIPRYMVAYMCYKNLRHNIQFPKHIQVMNNAMFFVVLCSSLFFFDIGANTSTVFSRFLRFSTIPACMLLSYFYENGYWQKLTKNTFYFFFISTLYTLVYNCYAAG